ncbi:hypothetical protein AX15_006005 [Amanita polypyramis BW_CC]|nr:hypothetical protein AX15_006005 [Amanita polypyramis BW_CC]
MRTIKKLAGSAMPQCRKAHGAEEKPVFVCCMPAKLIKLTGPPPLNYKGMVEEEEVSEEMKEAFTVWMKQDESISEDGWLLKKLACGGEDGWVISYGDHLVFSCFLVMNLADV